MAAFVSDFQLKIRVAVVQWLQNLLYNQRWRGKKELKYYWIQNIVFHFKKAESIWTWKKIWFYVKKSREKYKNANPKKCVNNTTFVLKKLFLNSFTGTITYIKNIITSAEYAAFYLMIFVLYDLYEKWLIILLYIWWDTGAYKVNFNDKRYSKDSQRTLTEGEGSVHLTSLY